MNEPYSIPSIENLKILSQQVDDYMRPSILPDGIIQEAVLSDKQCDDIINAIMIEESYTFPKCHATTRECPRPLSNIFLPIIDFTLTMNQLYWDFHLDYSPGAWMQTYSEGDSYQIHTDAIPGQIRKLTTIVLLSDEKNYEGGDLHIVPYPLSYTVPKTRGTMCVFPSWILHEVLPITSGIRQTINLGYWGPPFK